MIAAHAAMGFAAMVDVAASDGEAPSVAVRGFEEGRDFWSFRPVAKPPVPDVADFGWVKAPIDAFVLAALEEKGLYPAPQADKRTLIRRVTFDLIGLPPTLEEIESFLADDASDALVKIVERLLASPHYGIRWGRHWLDVVRYADSNGLDENLAYGNAWRYRDYVVEAFNKNKPFNRFLVEQIAGDLIAGANRESKIATGYLVLGAKVLGEPDMEKLVMDTIDEQLDTTGQAFLGMTLGCVRCHDHKFDPITQADYYALAAIFKSTRTFSNTRTGAIKHWHEHSYATEQDRAQLKKIDTEIAEKKKAAASFKNQATNKLRRESRAKATKYLVAATKCEPTMPLTQIEAIAKPLGLHPRILRHCRRYLEYNRDDSFFGKWYELSAVGDVNGIEEYYRTLFDGAETALAAARKKGKEATAIEDQRFEPARAALYDVSGFLAVPAKPEFAFDVETLAEYHRLAEEARSFESNAPDEPAVMGVSELTVLDSLPIHIRGSHLNLGTTVRREFPEVMRTSIARTNFPAKQSGRLELARWMANAQHPLTARVYVNRVWGWHFGSGIVTSTENFGKLGNPPSHPQLLDWLARHFMESGWVTKDLHRLIMSSNAYQMASLHPEELLCNAVDSENQLLWKFGLQRLEAEQLRDAILAVSRRLDESIGGKTVPLRNRQFVFNHTSVDHTKYESLRRAIFLPVIRNNLYTLFEQFDFPDPTMPTGSRNSTVVAPQALLMMNSELVMDSADQWAMRLLSEVKDDAQRVKLAYERAFGRQPTERELRRDLVFVDELTSQAVTTIDLDPLDEQRAWSLYCQSLFASNEFLYVR